MARMYAMQRANGDWYAMSEAGGFCVPVFNCNSDAMQARSLNSEMLHFKPMRLDDDAIYDLSPAKAEVTASFRLVSDPSLNLFRGRLISHSELTLLSRNGQETPHPGLGNLS